MNEWAVYRLDYNANEFVVEKGLSKAKADRLAEEYIAKGHHQHYWVDKQPSGDPDYAALMSSMLESGSSQTMAIRVLLSQGASNDECVTALMASCQLQFDVCMERVLSVVALLDSPGK